MINIQENSFQKIKDYIDIKYYDLFYYNKFRNGVTLSITDQDNNLYGFINDNIEIPIFVPSKNIGIAADSFIEYLKYKNINTCKILFNEKIIDIYQKKQKLKIERYDIIDIYNFDFSLILIKDETLYHKGAKIKQNYIDENGDIIVTIYFEDIIGDRLIFNKISNNRLLGFKKHIVWWTETNEVGLEKYLNVKKISRKEEGDILRIRRQRQISNLENLAMGTAAEALMLVIYDHYDKEISNYINRRSKEFENNMNTELNETIIYYLNIKLPHEFDEYLIDLEYDSDNNKYTFYINANYENCYFYHYGEINNEYVLYNLNDELAKDKTMKCKYIEFVDKKYKFEIEISEREWIDDKYHLILPISVKEYILHEIDETQHENIQL